MESAGRKRRQEMAGNWRLCGSRSEEILELERELRKAYIAKELKTQLIEAETDRYVKEVRERREEKILRRTEEEELKERRLREKQRRVERTESYRSDLAAQMEEKEAERRSKMAEARMERETLTIVDEIREEREKRSNVARKSDAADILRRQNFILQRMKEIRVAEAAEEEKEKEMADEEHLDKMAGREKGAKLNREARLARKEERIAAIAELLLNREIERRVREELLLELTNEDVKCEILKREGEEDIRREKMRVDLAGNLKEQIELEEECKLRFARQDKMFEEEILRKIEEDEKMAKRTMEARRRMRAEYREQLDKLIETRCRIREEETKKLQRDKREEVRRRETELEGIKEIRKELLEEHALNVAAFIDKNSLSEEERRIVEKFQ